MLTPNNELVSVMIDGKAHSQWESYDIDSDLMTPADAWQVSIGLKTNQLPDFVQPWVLVEVKVGNDTVLTGRVDEITDILARAEYLDGSAAAIKRVVQDQVLFAQGTEPVHVPDFMFQHREAANFPWVSQAAWLYAQMCAAGHAVPNPPDYESAQGVFRPDVYRAALRPMGVPLPGASAKLEGSISNPVGVGTTQGRLILGADGFFDGQSFDPEAYAVLVKTSHLPNI